jgi:hypothetical protein
MIEATAKYDNTPLQSAVVSLLSYNIHQSHPTLHPFLSHFPGTVIGCNKTFIQHPYGAGNNGNDNGNGNGIDTKGVGMMCISDLSDDIRVDVSNSTKTGIQNSTSSIQDKARTYNWNMLNGMLFRYNHDLVSSSSSSWMPIGALPFVNDGTKFDQRCDWVLGSHSNVHAIKIDVVKCKERVEQAFREYWHCLERKEEIRHVLSQIDDDASNINLINSLEWDDECHTWKYDTSCTNARNLLLVRGSTSHGGFLGNSPAHLQQSWNEFETLTRAAIAMEGGVMAQSDATALIAGMAILALDNVANDNVDIPARIALSHSMFSDRERDCDRDCGPEEVLNDIRDIVTWGCSATRLKALPNDNQLAQSIQNLMQEYHIVAFHDSGDCQKDEDDEFCQQVVFRLGGAYALCCIKGGRREQENTLDFHRWHDHDDGVLEELERSLCTPNEFGRRFRKDSELGLMNISKPKIVYIAMPMDVELVEALSSLVEEGFLSAQDVVLVQG